MEGKTSVGPDVENGGVCDVLALGVIEPVELVTTSSIECGGSYERHPTH